MIVIQMQTYTPLILKETVYAGIVFFFSFN